MFGSHYCPVCNKLHAGFDWNIEYKNFQCRYCWTVYEVTPMGLRKIKINEKDRFGNILLGG